MAVSLSNLEKNDSMYVCVRREVYLHRDEGKSRVCVCVCCVRTCEDRSYFKSFQPSGIGRQKDSQDVMKEIMEERSIHLEKKWVLLLKEKCSETVLFTFSGRNGFKK